MNLIAYMGNNSLEYAGISRADLYVDITGVIEKKVQALDYTPPANFTEDLIPANEPRLIMVPMGTISAWFLRFFLWLVTHHPLLARIT